MRKFARDFFTRFGAQVQTGDEGELIVDLPPDLAERFGKPRLHLAFASSELSPYRDLVAYGSRTFETMLEMLDSAGQRVHGSLPARHSVSADALPDKLIFPRAEVTVEGDLSWPLIALFHFRLTYTADERREEILSVALRLNAQPFPCQIEGQDIGPALNPLLGAAPEIDELTHVAQAAFERACRHAERVGKAFEAEITPRVRKTNLRLTSFYQRRIEALDEENSKQAAQLGEALQADLERKIGDELARNQVYVQVKPINLALIEWPVWRYRLHLQHRAGRLDLVVERELFGGQLLGKAGVPTLASDESAPWSDWLDRYQWRAILAHPNTLYIGRRRLGYAAMILDGSGAVRYAERIDWLGGLWQRLTG